MAFIALPVADGVTTEATGPLAGFDVASLPVMPAGGAFFEHVHANVLGETAEDPVLEDLAAAAAKKATQKQAQPTAGTGNNKKKNNKKKNKKKKKKKGKGRRNADDFLGTFVCASERGQEMPDPYFVLGLEDFGYKSTDEQILTAYRAKVIETHPDKNGGQGDAPFVRVQEAYELLSNLERRQVYDSQYDVDDSLPSDRAIANDFFGAFGPAFERNARWSVTQPVPLLGDNSTPMEEVDAFYEFWKKFQSWRSFLMFAEHSEQAIRDAEDREEKRWMQRQNENEAKKRKKADNTRIKKLVDAAMAADPRIKRRRQEAKEARARAALEAKEARERAAREAEEAAAAAAAAKAEAEKAEKQRLKNEKKKLAKRRKDARRALRKLGPLIDAPGAQVESICSKLQADELEACNASIQTCLDAEDTDGAKAAFDAVFASLS